MSHMRFKTDSFPINFTSTKPDYQYTDVTKKANSFCLTTLPAFPQLSKWAPLLTSGITGFLFKWHHSS